MSLYVYKIIWFNDEVTYNFPLVVGARDYILAAANPNWQSDMTYYNSQKDNTDKLLLSPEGKYHQVWLLKPCKSGQSDTCWGADALKKAEMFLCFDKSWYQPLLKVFSSANLASSCKINITIGVWWETAAKMCVVLPGLTPLIQVRQQPLQHRDGAVWWHRIPLYWWC